MNYNITHCLFFKHNFCCHHIKTRQLSYVELIWKYIPIYKNTNCLVIQHTQSKIIITQNQLNNWENKLYIYKWVFTFNFFLIYNFKGNRFFFSLYLYKNVSKYSRYKKINIESWTKFIKKVVIITIFLVDSIKTFL